MTSLNREQFSIYSRVHGSHVIIGDVIIIDTNNDSE